LPLLLFDGALMVDVFEDETPGGLGLVGEDGEEGVDLPLDDGRRVTGGLLLTIVSNVGEVVFPE